MGPNFTKQVAPFDGKSTNGQFHYWNVVNLGNPEALNWIINHFDGLITTQGIDVYR